jgi:intein/homing endonuclease
MYFYGIDRTIDRNVIKNEGVVSFPLFWRIVGYWLAEGSIQRSRAKSAIGMVWAFAAHENDYVSDIIRFFDEYKIPNYIEHIGGTQKLTITCGQFSRFIVKHFGHGAHDIHLPEWAVRLPVSCRIELLRGWWRGDGCYCGGKYRAVTVSHRLADDMQLLIQSLGFQ